jgi:hypothetical protein
MAAVTTPCLAHVAQRVNSIHRIVKHKKEVYCQVNLSLLHAHRAQCMIIAAVLALVLVSAEIFFAE